MSAVLPLTTAAQDRRSLHDHRLLLLVVTVHFAGALYVTQRFPLKFRHALGLLDLASTMAMGLLLALCGYTIFVMVVRRPARLLAYLGTELKQYLTRERLFYALPALLMLPLFTGSFTVFKAAIPLFQPQLWDSQLAAADAYLHGGVQPWVWLQAVLGHPVATAIINYNYHLWFFVLFGMVYWITLAKEHARLRMQVLLSFVFTWILLGNVLAMALASVGPCYFGKVFAGPDPFAALMDYLRTADRDISVWALTMQDLLWASREGRLSSAALGISAMPSMHVASSVQLALLGWSLHRRAGIALTVFAVLIMLGSVHLGWHYAIDGYIGAIGGWLIWKMVARLPFLPAATPGGRP
jgi:hypothetical protein